MLSTYIRYDKTRREFERERLRTQVYKVPIPATTVEQLSQLGPDDFADVMRSHPGFSVDRGITSVLAMLATFRALCADFDVDIQEFEAHCRRPLDRNRLAEAERRRIVEDVRKDIFTISTAAAALVQHARHIRKLVPDQEYTAELARIFDSAQHEFMIGLRKNFAHVTFLDADWRVNYALNHTEGTFEFSCTKLLRDGDFNETARAYIENSGDKINIPALFKDYRSRVESFHVWLRERIESSLPIEVADFRRCVKSHKAYMARAWYRVWLDLLLRKGIDPYEHLADYMDPQDLDEVSRLPLRSAAQVNRIIALVDEDEACDDELRGLVHRLFGIKP